MAVMLVMAPSGLNHLFLFKNQRELNLLVKRYLRMGYLLVVSQRKPVQIGWLNVRFLE